MTQRHLLDLRSATGRKKPPPNGSQGFTSFREHISRVRVAGILAGVVVLSYALVSTAAGAAPTTGSLPGPDDVPKSVAAPVDPVAPPVYQPASRKGQRPRPTVTANTGGFTATAPATFSDGVSVRVEKISRGVEQGEGPGVFAGRPNTALTLSLTNRTAQPIDLTQVVVATTYGTPAKVAAPVYEDPTAADFSGTVAPGATATATYVFAIPPGQARSAVTTVDFDDVHVAATFKGLGE